MTLTTIGLIAAAALAGRIAVATFWDGSDAARHSRRRVLRWWKRRG
jgi:hypothetical protein